MGAHAGGHLRGSGLEVGLYGPTKCRCEELPVARLYLGLATKHGKQTHRSLCKGPLRGNDHFLVPKPRLTASGDRVGKRWAACYLWI